MNSEKPFKKIAVVGLGLIGGSLALELKKRNLAEVVIGVARRPEVIAQARSSQAIDWGTTDFVQGSQEADLIFLCLPVFSIIEIFKMISPHLKPGTLVTDVGSTKGLIMKEISRVIRPDIFFVGGHPMAGGEKSGFEAAELGLFEKAIYILTPLANTPVNVLESFSHLVENLGSKIFFLTPHEHDRIVASISHLPYLTAVALVNSLLKLPDREKVLKFAASGFRDTTRIAASAPGMWQDICLSNRQEILKFLRILEEKIKELKKILSQKSSKKLNRFLSKSYQFRKDLF